jgi:hypothetical protein
MATKYIKWLQNIPNGYKIYQMATKYTKWLQNIPNGWDFGTLKMYHLATLICNRYPWNLGKGNADVFPDFVWMGLTVKFRLGYRISSYQGGQIFSFFQHTKTGKIYQMAIKHTKWQ